MPVYATASAGPRRNILERDTFVCAGFLRQSQNLLSNDIAHHFIGATGEPYTGREQHGILKVRTRRAETVILDHAGLAK